MKKSWMKKASVLGTLIILITLSIAPIQANENKKEVSSQTSHENGENILGTITVKHQSFWATGDLRDLIPTIIFNQSDTRDFYFEEIDGWIQLNFTVICKQRLENYTSFPRFTRYETYVKYNDDYIFAFRSLSYICWTLKWKYNNITLKPDQMINGLYTNGQSITLSYLQAGVRAFPGYLLTGKYINWEPITIHPIPTSS
jgi:hypothetical protein